MSVVVCTRDRLVELERCLNSLLQCQTTAFARVELVVVDDGASGAAVPNLCRRIMAGGLAHSCLSTSQAPGLFNARLRGLQAAQGELVLFVDDDVTVAPEYLTELGAAYERHPDAAGVGGVDQTDVPRPLVLRGLHRLFLYDSGRPGALSASGFPGATRRWIGAREDFASDYVHGCNMSFRKSALAGLAPVEWLEGYSLGEDLYVSAEARRTGPLFVCPALRVWHRSSQTSRDPVPDTGRAQTVNMFRLLRARDRSLVGALAFLWTMSWFVMKDSVRAPRMRLVPGYLRGFMDLVDSRRNRSPRAFGS